MKLFFTTAFLSLVILSCKKEKSIIQNASIVGKWTHTKDIVKHYSDNTFVDTETPDYTGSGEYIQFNTNKTGVLYQEDYIGSNTYETTNFNYLLNDTTLTLIADNKTSAATVKEITSNKLTIEIVSSYKSESVEEKDVIDQYYSK